VGFGLVGSDSFMGVFSPLSAAADFDELKQSFLGMVEHLRNSLRQQKEKRIAALMLHQRMKLQVPAFIEW
jgi:hypothetical protein